MIRHVVMLATLFVACAAAMGQGPKERKNIDQMTLHELAVYKHAIDLLKKSTDPTNNYVYHANLHNLFLSTPPHGCEHGNDLFFPWHRWHLANFEKALRQSDPGHPTLSTKDVTIPYWNWTIAPTGVRYPKAFENEFDGMANNPLFNDFRETAPSGPIYDEDYMTNIVRDSNWNSFAGGPKDTNPFYGTLEIDSHNTMHGTYIGGDMGDPTSASMDPIYWSFHAFIDMQWDRWQKIYNQPPTSPTKVLRGFTGAPKVSDTEKVADLGYFYTHSPESIAPAPPVPQLELVSRTVPLTTEIPGAESLVAAWGGEGPFSFKGIKPAAFQRADLWFDKVHIPETISYRVDVFLHLAGRKYQPGDKAGSFMVWKGHSMVDGTRHHTSANMFVPITEKLRKAMANNPEKELAVTVVATPIEPKTRPKGKKPSVRSSTEEVQFKGVRLVLDGGGPFQAHNQEDNHGH